MKIKTSELIGKPLNWAVESIEIARMRAAGEHVKEWWVQQKQSDPSPYSTDWLLGGPIIEREKIEIRPRHRETEAVAPWGAFIRLGRSDFLFADGPTPLTAAMRCYVASKLGDEVDIPEELA